MAETYDNLTDSVSSLVSYQSMVVIWSPYDLVFNWPLQFLSLNSQGK